LKQEGLDPGSFSSFGALLKHLRRRARLTQSELGIAVGYSETYITRLEGDSRLPDPVLIRARFVDALGLRDAPHLAQQLIALAEATYQRARKEPGAPAAKPDSLAPTATVTAPFSAGSLPLPLTHFVGRQHELAEVTRLLKEARLVTLTGSGGVGKTRLTIEAGLVARDQFEGGVWFVPLAPVTDPARVLRAVVDAFGLPDLPNHSLLESAAAHISDQHLLLILDNCEHLIHACAELAEGLLRACPHLHLLATSREWLNVHGETAWRVPSLTLDETRQLFLDRACAALPSFAMTAQNADAVAAICAQLDGIPLAVELAAARLSAMSAEQLATRLGDRFRLLTGGSRTALPRQQTLRATIDWSYELLPEPERRLLRWLSVFADGWTVEAAESVCACPEGCDVLSLLLNLVDKSLVLVDDAHGETRYRMLEMVRQYALEKLAARGELDGARHRYARYYLALAEEHAPPIMRQARTPIYLSLIEGHQPWVQRIDRERDNVRSALMWCLREAQDPDDIETGVQLALWLYVYWDLRGPIPEGCEWMGMALGHTDPTVPTQARGRLLIALANFMRWMGESALGEATAREALAICRDRGDRFDTLMALWELSEQSRVSVEEAQALIEEWIAIARSLGDALTTGAGLWYLGLNRQQAGDVARAAELYDESLSVLPAQEQGAVHIARYYQGALMWTRLGGESGLAQIHEALTHFRENGFELGIVVVLHWLGERALAQNDVLCARRYLNECLGVAYRDGAWLLFVSCVGSLAVAEAMAGQHERAVILMSAAQRLNASAVSADQQERMVAARSQLDPPALAEAEAAGRAMSFHQVVAYAQAYAQPG
jgi:predicted ATPase